MRLSYRFAQHGYLETTVRQALEVKPAVDESLDDAFVSLVAPYFVRCGELLVE